MGIITHKVEQTGFENTIQLSAKRGFMHPNEGFVAAKWRYSVWSFCLSRWHYVLWRGQVTQTSTQWCRYLSVQHRHGACVQRRCVGTIQEQYLEHFTCKFNTTSTQFLRSMKLLVPTPNCAGPWPPHKRVCGIRTFFYRGGRTPATEACVVPFLHKRFAELPDDGPKLFREQECFQPVHKIVDNRSLCTCRHQTFF